MDGCVPMSQSLIFGACDKYAGYLENLLLFTAHCWVGMSPWFLIYIFVRDKEF